MTRYHDTSASLGSTGHRLAAMALMVVLLAACGSDGDTTEPSESSGADPAVASDSPTTSSPTTTLEQPATTTQAPAPTQPPSGIHVSLGSSFAAGIGAGDVVEPVCGRTTESYPRLVATELGLDLIDLGCGGATIDHIVDTTQILGTEARPPQIESVPANAELITITVGGNDVGYIGNFFVCAAGCPDGHIDTPRDRDDRFDDLADELEDMIELVEETAPDAHIVLVGYVRLLDGPDDTCEGIDAGSAEFHHDMGERLQAVFVDAADDTDITFVDAYAASAGHGVCQPPELRWVEGMSAAPPAFAWHPNSAGTAAIADLVLAQIDR